MANQYAVPDGNNNAGLIAHSGTAGTAETVRVVASSDGGLRVSNEGAASPLTSLDFEHYEIHEGDHFFIQNFATVGVGTSVDFIVTTGTVNTHMLFEIDASYQTEFYIYENPTLGTGGTALTAYNSNRNSSGTSTLSIKINQVVGTVGTLLGAWSIGGSASPVVKAGGELGRAGEIILKNQEDYVFRITSRSNDNIISYHGYWYEHNV